MNLHEYQSKQLLASFGAPVLKGVLCYTPGEVEAAADLLGGDLCVIKVQVHAGGRGKGGGVKLARSAEEARQHGEALIGMTLVTPQTGPKGKLMRKVYVEAGCNIGREFYLSLLVDRAKKNISIVACREGGMEIEVVAHKTPEKIINIGIDPRVGLQRFQSLRLGFSLGLSAGEASKLADLMPKVYRTFVESDLSLLEINPLVLTKEGEFVLLDAKCAVDDNAIYRHPALRAYLDYDEMDARDLRASKFGLSYVGLEGTIGCLVNGAGLAMATMDIIKHYGGEPANFLDVGGGASRETVTEAFKILLSDEKVEAILVNIFGGILRCDVLANGIVEAAKEVGVEVPLVVRLEGTNVEEGRKILSNSGLKIVSATSMGDAAEKVISAAKKGRRR